MDDKLREAFALVDREKKTEACAALLYNGFVTNDVDGLKKIFDACTCS